ncbi:MAG: class I SAM-dependent methyltransferase [Candidatus Beckwithbacteria bacterium]
MNQREIIFTKYQNRGAYHWQQIRKNLFTFNAFVLARYQQVLGQIPSNKNLKFLDIGCGDGVLLYLISQKTKAQLFGIDSDSDSLKTAKSKVNAKFFQASAYKLPFKTQSFDIVIASEIIEHLKNPEKMLSEIKRVLKPKGLSLITTPVKLFPKPEDPMHVQEFSTSDLNNLLTKYFSKVIIKTSHPYLIKKIYTTPWFKINRFYFEPLRWLINLLFFLFKFNPFCLKGSRPSQQLAIIKK